MPLDLDKGTLKISRVLFSVTDKTGIEDVAEALREVDPEVEIFGTPGSQGWLEKKGLIDIQSISVITQEKPQSFKHRMSSISYPFTSSLIFDREDPDQVKEAAELGLDGIDLIVCNLYDFEKTIKEERANGTTGEALIKIAIEKIDIGGPCMVRAAAKNHRGVAILTDPAQYPDFIAELRATGTISLETRKNLMKVAFKLTADYDSKISAFFESAYAAA